MSGPSLERLLAPHPRVRAARDGAPASDGACVVYWMQRAQRGVDNPALNMAIAVGDAIGKPVIAVFGLTADYPAAQRRHYRFLVEGLVDARADLERRGVPLVVRLGSPEEVVPAFAEEVGAAFVVGDENPVRVGRRWREVVARALKVPFHLVDADVVVPTSLFPKEEYAARTLRPKIHRVWDEYLKPIPEIRARQPWPGEIPDGAEIEPDSLMKALRVGGVGEVPGYVGGTREAMRRLKRFLDERLHRYAEDRNEPTPYCTTELSAHLHYGHISPTTIALAAIQSDGPREGIDVLLEELIVRRELAINFVARNPDYDSLAGCPEWARKTLAKHADDPRPVVYTSDQLERAETHDPLWNASQKEMTLTGRMHNYLRMYWAKKILEWSPTAEQAFAVAVELNDRYEMDGRDPNGYTGVAWAVGGKHDRPWPERPIFGTVRFMSYESTRKKFDSAGYIRRVESIAKQQGQA
ncbi:deoxyribodipyrimidine photo-lyase [Planctomyces sp. SH-PL62]|uniref:deoxyribodipyrimidine photo-lyase n=1 Tax=Planctomyces sp. SH-PL62 TaxID=1636152 RepID=UPI00078D7815|nr:deoxyribodipyrimidine photo-lyase [Planctomyces sp. SH-PL62]AMV36176.1 Deoxyribodipyrimidine photo-lyase [Planctomyces sp. SH-PL62]